MQLNQLLHKIHLRVKPPAKALENILPDGTVAAAAFLPAMGQVRLTGNNGICISYDVCQSSHRELVQQLGTLGWQPQYRPTMPFMATIHDLLEQNLRAQAKKLLPWESKLRYSHFICGEAARQRLPHNKLWRRHMSAKK